MAKPIQLDFPPRNAQTEPAQRLAEAPAEHAAALLELLELIEVLHQRNVLSTLRGAVGAGDDLVSYIAHAAAQPESIRAMRNFLALSKLFGKLDPELIESIERSIPPQLQDRNERRTRPAPSLWKIGRLFVSAPVRRALMATGFILAGIGYYMNKETPGTADRA
jgi:uncharacterized protein YjgD (DUF1641 family)